MTMEEPEDTYYLIIWSQLGSYFSFFLKFANYMFSKQIYIMRFLYCVIFSLSYSFNLPLDFDPRLESADLLDYIIIQSLII